MFGRDLPPAVVLGIDTPIGLTIIRDLGSHGVDVIGLAGDRNSPGLASRYLHEGLLRAKGEDALVAQLRELGTRLGKACLFAISEGDISLLNRHRDELAPWFSFMFADAERMDRVLNKDRTYAAARAVGIKVPETAKPATMDEVRAAAATLRFPVITKWPNPIAVMKTLSATGLKLDKIQYCWTAQELLAYLAPFERAGVYPLIQEYCPGYGLGQFVLMKGGQACYTFQHRRVHEYPPEGGFSSMCESVPPHQHQALMEKSIALLRALEWEGVAMVEYRYDPETDTAGLMEINGRFWGSLPLAYHCGASFPWFVYQLFGLGTAPDMMQYRDGIRCRFMIPETKRVLRILFNQGSIADKTLSFSRWRAIADYLREFVSRRGSYYVFDRRDPVPFFRDMGNVVLSRLRRRN